MVHFELLGLGTAMPSTFGSCNGDRSYNYNATCKLNNLMIGGNKGKVKAELVLHARQPATKIKQSQLPALACWRGPGAVLTRTKRKPAALVVAVVLEEQSRPN
jgi:hypothetical protein